MAYVLDVFLTFIMKSVKGFFYAIAFVFVALFLFGTWQLAKDYTISVTLVCGMIFGFFAIASGLNPSSLARSQTWIRHGDGTLAGIFLLVGVLVVLGYKGYGVYQRDHDPYEKLVNLAKAEPPIPKPVASSTTQYPTSTASIAAPAVAQSGPSCQQLGMMYGRASVKGMRGEYVNPAEDPEIPPRCQNQASTNAGIRAGIESESRR
ncbi:hypothetical protein [Pseudomonas sp. HY13-MNA-CIBAN-0226]|uniref:hypothetical protein n=1 Tax=Pseudomonas sp. HY13-MNA-CIBAN-0226 TaxID=3140473 RepID=UPI00331FBBFA